jgi:hypothetical protein
MGNTEAVSNQPSAFSLKTKEKSAANPFCRCHQALICHHPPHAFADG